MAPPVRTRMPIRLERALSPLPASRPKTCDGNTRFGQENKTVVLRRRKQGAQAATINRETSALSRMFQLAIRRGLLDRMPLSPNRLHENPPRLMVSGLALARRPRDGTFEGVDHKRPQGLPSLCGPRADPRAEC